MTKQFASLCLFYLLTCSCSAFGQSCGDSSPWYGEPYLPFERNVPHLPRTFEKYEHATRIEWGSGVGVGDGLRIPLLRKPSSRALSPEALVLLMQVWHDASNTSPELQFIAKKFGTVEKFRNTLKRFEDYQLGSHTGEKHSYAAYLQDASEFTAKDISVSRKVALELLDSIDRCYETIKANFSGYIYSIKQIEECKKILARPDLKSKESEFFTRILSQIESLEEAQSKYRLLLIEVSTPERIDEIDQQLSKIGSKF